MKKELLTSLLALTLLAGCNNTNNSVSNPISESNPISQPNKEEYSDLPSDSTLDTPDNVLNGRDPEEVAKLILANQRLDSNALSNVEIFNDGAKVFKKLAKEAKMARNNIVLNNNGLGTVVVEGDRYSWSDFGEYCNSADYFNSITTMIETNAIETAKLIDDTKENVRIVDKWIDFGNEQIMLKVDATSETIYKKDNDSQQVFKRTKNEVGENVYEYVTKSFRSNYTSRTTYIEGKRYEFVEDYMDRPYYFIADNSKGEWELLTLSIMPTHYNIGVFVMGETLAYDFFFNIEQQGTENEIPMVKFISSDRKTDILNIDHQLEDWGTFSLKLTGFDGVKEIYLHASEDEIFDVTELTPENGKVCVLEDGTYFPASIYDLNIVLDNGKEIKSGDKLIDDKVEIGAIRVGTIGTVTGQTRFYPEIEFKISANSFEERLMLLKQASEELGLRCRRDFEEVIESIEMANDNAYKYAKFFKLNGYHLNIQEELDKGLEIENQETLDLLNGFEELKDYQVVNYYDVEDYNANIVFAKAKNPTIGSVKVTDEVVIIEDMSLTIDDTLLYVDRRNYKVSYALAHVEDVTYSNLIDIELTSFSEVTYDGSESFFVTTDATFNIPLLIDGQYTLVAYVSTSNNIRLSTPVAIKTNEDLTSSYKVENKHIDFSKSEEGTINISYVTLHDIDVGLLQCSNEITYKEIIETVSAVAYESGFLTNNALEIKDETGEYKEVIYTDEDLVVSGEYRFKYLTKNGSSYIDSYINFAITNNLTYEIDDELVKDIDTYDELELLLSQKVLEDGQANTDFVIYTFEGKLDEWIVFEKTEDTLPEGIYKMKYTTLIYGYEASGSISCTIIDEKNDYPEVSEQEKDEDDIPVEE